ncbi:MAG: 2Fe-2S iron-sulfur cluster-binding protein [Parasphingopyxis sp.]|uniref:2Fe-2S iron-sulfur cluster-binding protein n=1 Tax=Parasphingopyxis sp. TaxID=1920299 RepID=UPI0032EBC37E
MVEICFVEADGNEIVADAAIGDTLMQTAKNAGVAGVLAECGGSMVCGTCHVFLKADWYERLAPPGEIEEVLIEGAPHPQPTSRLSCQIQITAEMEGMEVAIPETQL